MVKKDAADEEAFERGRPEPPPDAKPKKRKEGKEGKGRGKGDRGDRGDGAPEKRRKKGSREPEDLTDDEQKLSSRARRLGTAHYREGSLVLAAVREVTDEELTLNLPYNVLAYVQRGEAAGDEKLLELYKAGQLVVAVILTAMEVGTGERKKVRLEASLRPSLVNAGLSSEQLRPKMFLSATVVSEEEHVLSLDLGDVQGIIKKKEFRSQGLEIPACGRIVHVTVQSVEGTVKCSLSCGDLAEHERSAGHDWLRPGFLVSGRVKSVEENGLVVNVEGLTTVLHRHHLPEAEWTKNQKIVARVMAILPQPYPVVQLTLLPHLLEWKSLEQGHAAGEVLVGEVLDFQTKYGCRVRLEDGVGFCPISKLTDEGKDLVHASVAPGFKAQYRVLGFNFLDGTPHLTRRPADLEEGVLVSVTELSPGQLVKGTVSRIADHGIHVKLSSYVHGQVHLRQLTDVPLAAVPKRLQLGAKVKCRVLHVHAKRKQLTLTAKKSLVKSDFQLTRNTDAKFNQLLTGYISSIHDFGAIVSFYGGARGLLPKKDMDAEEAPALGMAVTCRVVHVDKTLDRLTCSLNLENGRPAGEIEAESAEKVKPVRDSVVSDIKAVYAGSDGIVVKFKNLRDEEHLGYVLKGHLSDDVDIAQKRFTELLEKLPQGDLSQAAESKAKEAKVKLPERGVVLMKHYIVNFKKKNEKNEKSKDAKSKDDKDDNGKEDGKDGGADEKASQGPGFTLLSLKASMLLAWEAGCFVTKASDLQEGRFYSGYVREVMSHGALVCLGTQRITGFAHKFELSKRFVEDPHEVLSAGDSVRAQLRKIVEERGGFEVDLRPALCTDQKLLAREAEALRLSLLQRDWGEDEEDEDEEEKKSKKKKKSKKGFRPGSVVQGEVTKIESYGLVLSVKDRTAVALKENMPEMKTEVGQVLKCVVLDYNAEARILDVSLHPELLERHGRPEKGMELQVLPALSKKSYCVCWSRKPAAVVFAAPYAMSTWKFPITTVLHSAESPMVVHCPFPAKEKKASKVPRISRPAEELQCGSPVTMRVRSVNGLQVFCAAPVNLQGHIHATQLVDLEDLDGAFPLSRMQRSQTLEARVLRLRRRGKVWHLELTARPSLLKNYEQVEQAIVTWSSLKPGMKLPAAVVSVHKNHLWVEVASGIKGRVALLDCSDDVSVLRSLAEHFQAGQVLPARVLRVKGSHKELDLSLRPETSPKLGQVLLAQLNKIQDGAIAATMHLADRRWAAVHITELFDVWTKQPTQRLKVGNFYEVAVLESGETRLEVSLRSSQVRGTAEAQDERRPAAADAAEASRVSGYVVSAGPQGVFVALSRTLTGRIRLKNLSDAHIMKESVAKLYPVGTLLRDVTVLEVKDSGVELSLVAAASLTAEQLSIGDLVSGKVKAIEAFGLFVRLENSKVDGFVHKSEISDSASTSVESFKVGMQVKAKVLKVEGRKVSLTLKDLPDASDESESEDFLDVVKAVGTKRKVEEPEEPDEAEEAEETVKAKKKKKAKAPPKAEEEEDSDVEPWQSRQKGSSAAFEFAEFKVDSASSSDEKEEEEDEDEPKQKLSKRQKKAKRKEEEMELQKREAENADGRAADNPRSVEDFERLLLTQGDTSIVWIRYMAFHLKMSDLEKARQVAERAVKHVGFADSKERFNVWVAFMNLECTFGTEQSADAIFRRASSHNDAKQVYMQLARIHERNKKKQLAVKAYEACTRKFAHSKKVWIAFLTFLYQNEDAEGARKVLPKSLAALPRRKHPVVVSKAAILEYQNGSPDRGRSIFEGLLDSYPKRTDLWAIYFDAHIKAFTPPRVEQADFKEIRPLFQRCCAMSLKATKMRFFFKRWLDFETKWGDEESQEDVRTKAREYVEGQA